jgi:hypothetical protein
MHLHPSAPNAPRSCHATSCQEAAWPSSGEPRLPLCLPGTTRARSWVSGSSAASNLGGCLSLPCRQATHLDRESLRCRFVCPRNQSSYLLSYHTLTQMTLPIIQPKCWHPRSHNAIALALIAPLSRTAFPGAKHSRTFKTGCRSSAILSNCREPGSHPLFHDGEAIKQRNCPREGCLVGS